jgi:hypothetical protein
MIEILIDKIQRPFLVQFLPASLLDVSATITAENSGGWNGNQMGPQNRSENVRSCMGRFVQYLP